MIHFKACFHKSMKKYGVILSLLFILILVLINFSMCIDFHINKEQNKEVYKTIYVTPKEDWNIIKNLKENSRIIEEYYVEDSNLYSIKFINYKEAQKYALINTNNFSKISVATFDLDSTYGILKNVTKILIAFSGVVVLFLIFFFSINIIYNMEKDISLYKLIGYKNSKIIGLTLFSIYFFYFLLYILAIMIINVSYYLFGLKGANIISNVSLLNLLDLKAYLYIWGIISISIILSFLRIIFKIKNNSPIKLIKEY